MKIFLIDDKAGRLSRLRLLLRDLPSVGFIEVEEAIYSKPPSGIDALFLTLPAAEDWNPVPTSREMQVLRTPKYFLERGFPSLIVTGVNLRPEDPRDPVSQVRIVLGEAITAAMAHNRCNSDEIRALGFWVMTLSNVWFEDASRAVTIEQISGLMHELLASGSS